MSFQTLSDIKRENAANEAAVSRTPLVECPIHGEPIVKNSKGQGSCPYGSDGQGHVLSSDRR
jgi:hypothetical protein